MVVSLPEMDRLNFHKDEAKQKLAMTMGGKAAEILKYGEEGVSNGPAGDIMQASSLARAMVMRWGMSDKLGPVALEASGSDFLGNDQTWSGGGKPYSEATASLADSEVKRIVNESWEEALGLLTRYRSELELLTHALLERETVDERDVLEITGLSHV